jgi:formamidopyrimidine-DNA glycosylase
MPELAETYLIARQVATIFGVPFHSDAELSSSFYPDARRLKPSFKFKALDPVYAHIDGVEMNLEKISHRGKKIWLHGVKPRWPESLPLRPRMLIEVSLGMTGRFSIDSTKHDRVRLLNGQGYGLNYSDIRKFGRLKIVPNDMPEPLMPSVTSVQIRSPSNLPQVLKYLRKKNRPIKIALTDQQCAFSGVGNYMANEMLAMARIHPKSLTRALELEDVKHLLQAARQIATTSEQNGGCTLQDFRDVYGNPGRYQHLLSVYKKTDCPRCGITLKHEPIGSTAHYCGWCQLLKTDLITSENLERTSV